MPILFRTALVLALTACGTSPSSNANTASIEAAGQQSQAPADQGRPFRTEPVMRFGTPWAMDFLPGSSSVALVTEKEGNLWLVDVSTGERSQVSGVPDAKVAGQGGLGDVVAHPDFAANRRVYLSFVEAGPGDTSGAALGYGGLVTGDGQPRIEGFKVIWRQEPKVTGNGHFAHRIAFAPDGTMFVSSGDRQKMQPAQDPNSDLGKIIHMTDEGERIGGRFATMGHRNILGLDFAPDGRLWATEMGPAHGDEINLILKGRNYGWPEVSYGSHYDGEDIPDDHDSRGFEEPKAWWNPAVSPAGMIVYSGDLFPQWKGDILAGGLSGQALLHVELEGDSARKARRWDMEARIREIAEAPDGSVYILEDGRSPGQGRLLRLTPAR
ncbi:MAG TPA: PQQ-dependent sugar dehydrogenase [Sphingomicrobium sp.]|nr:PQQ-dependent sugar dehydrogenase [Sphingomicrobium sp.]